MQSLNSTRSALLIAFAVVLFSPADRAWAADDAEHDHAIIPAGIPDLTPRTLDLASRIAIQEGGRIKPLATFAGFSMLSIHHKRTFEDAAGEKHKPIAWLVRTMLYPQRAMDDPIFTIESDEVLNAIGLQSIVRKKRDRYSFRELLKGERKLYQLAREYGKIESKDRERMQGQIILLAHAMSQYEGLLSALWFGAIGVPLESDDLRSLFGGRERVRVSEALRKVNELGSDSRPAGLRKKLGEAITRTTDSSHALVLLPPLSQKGHKSTWYSIASVGKEASRGELVPEPDIQFVERLEALVRARENVGSVEQAMDDLLADSRARAEQNATYDKIGLEVFYYRLDAFGRSMYLFVTAFLLIAFSWMFPRARIPSLGWQLDKVLVRSAVALLVAGFLLSSLGITLRCILRGRPPVSTLYETVIFISALGVGVTLVIEWMTRQRIALIAAPIVGALGLALAQSYEVLDGKDTMPQLGAVLDTNYWLALHVTCIIIGYGAGLLAALIAHFYVLGKVFGWRRADKPFYRNIGRIVYGCFALSLIFSVVGTILGGVWANDSWGRFWGWDPKENGALMIVLSQLAIVHARQGGYIKTFGLCMSLIAGGMVIAFSWWGVNQLSVGLHSYGFTQGIATALNTFYLVELGVLVAGGGAWLFWERRDSGGRGSNIGRTEPPPPPTTA